MKKCINIDSSYYSHQQSIAGDGILRSIPSAGTERSMKHI